MFIKSYVKIALRNLAKNRLYAVINIVGLAIGLTLFLFSTIIANYETNHDAMFSQRDRIYTVGTTFKRAMDVGLQESNAVPTAVGPIIEAEIEDLEAVARTIYREYFVSRGADNFYQLIRFADSELTRLFDFSYLHGDAAALRDPQGLILTAAAARKFFGRTDVLGETLELNHKLSMHVAAVIADVAPNSHFNSSLIRDSALEVIAPFAALQALEKYAIEGEWGDISSGHLTYMLLPESKNQQWLQDQLDGIYARHVEDKRKEYIAGFRVRPLVQANTQLWDAIGLPMLATLRLLGLLVLVVACVNYTNLATAQSFGRTREVGLRKTFGADRRQLLAQFLTESLTTALLAMLLAVAALELLVPLFNQATGKAVTLNYLATLPWLLLTTLLVGLFAGGYPAYLITSASALASLKNAGFKARSGNGLRSFMIGVQFAISIFMLATVLVVFSQNQQIELSSQIYPRDQVVVLERVDVKAIQRRHDTLRDELLKLPGVASITFSSQVPFQQRNNTADFSPARGDKTATVGANLISIDHDFLQTYNIPLRAGRNLRRDVANDQNNTNSRQTNVILNELAAARLGFGAETNAIGKSFYNTYDKDGDKPRDVQYTVVGLVPDQNFLGLQNEIKPIVFMADKSLHTKGSVRIESDQLNETLQAIDASWARVMPDYPLQRRFLDDVFAEAFKLFRASHAVLSGFALVALSLALIGLFGLSAFMAARRTREIGIRKVLGARVGQIMWLLVWQFSIPVMWSLLVALPLAYLASNMYLNFFAERTTLVIPIMLLASVTGVVTAWAIVAAHAFKVANARPMRSLRYE